MALELELSGYGMAAWDLSPAQLLSRVQKLARMREAQDFRHYDATAMSQCTDKELLDSWVARKL